MRTVNPAEVGLDPQQLDRLTAAIDDDVAREVYDGAVVLVARRGAIALHTAIGYAERATGRRLRPDDVFHAFSITKTLTATTVLQRIERGELALTTRVADLLPEFGIRGKNRITVEHLLTHTGGLSTMLPPLPPELLGNLETFVEAIGQQLLDAIPGSEVNYSPLAAHAVLAQIVRRLDGGQRRFREILADDVLEPLGMKETWLGSRPDLAKRRVPIVVRDRSPGLFEPELLESMNDLLAEDSEVPGAGAISTAADLARWGEALRQGGTLDGARVLLPGTVRLATTNHTGERPNRLWAYAHEMRGWAESPAYIGLTFWVRGHGVFPHFFGTLASPGTFGHAGAGTAVFWVDPERELVFVCLTAGALEETRNIERFQRLSDLAHAAVVD